MTSGSIRFSFIRMRTTLDLPEDLIADAMRALQFKSKTDTVVHALRELLRRKQLEELKGLAGKVVLQVDVKRSRRRGR